MKKIIGLLLLTLATIAAASATTFWGITGDNVVNGGTLVAKNLDANPKYGTRLEFVVPKTTGYRYLADILYSPAGVSLSVQSGINEKGLAVASAAGAKAGFNEWALNNYGSVDDLLIDKNQASGYAPGAYLIADSGKMALIEIAAGGRISAQEFTGGDICYSNKNITYRRVKELIAQHSGLFGLDDVVVYSQDRHDGPNNSLWRSGSSERTIASWVVNLPDSGAPQLYIRTVNGDEGESGKLTLDNEFWGNQPAGQVSFGAHEE